MDTLQTTPQREGPSRVCEQRGLVRFLNRTDRYRPLRWHIGSRRVSSLVTLLAATVPAFMVAVSLVAYAFGLMSRPRMIDLMLTYAEIPALLLLSAALWCTPLTTLTGRSFVRPRKILGLGFATAGWGNPIAFLLQHPLRSMSKPFAILGSLSLLASVPLVATSSRSAIRRLGRNWKRLHRIFYVVAVLCVAHLWLVPQDDGPTANIIATIVVGGALLLRVPRVRKRITSLRKQRGGSLLSARTWLVTADSPID